MSASEKCCLVSTSHSSLPCVPSVIESSSNTSVHNASSKSRELHRLHRDFNKANVETFLAQKSVDVCLCILDFLEDSSAKDPTSVFEIPYRFFAKDFVNSGLTVVNNTDLLVHRAL